MNVIPKPPDHATQIEAMAMCYGDRGGLPPLIDLSLSELGLLLALVRAYDNSPICFVEMTRAFDAIKEQAPHLIDAARKAREEGTP